MAYSYLASTPGTSSWIPWITRNDILGLGHTDPHPFCLQLVLVAAGAVRITVGSNGSPDAVQLCMAELAVKACLMKPDTLPSHHFFSLIDHATAPGTAVFSGGGKNLLRVRVGHGLGVQCVAELADITSLAVDFSVWSPVFIFKNALKC